MDRYDIQTLNKSELIKDEKGEICLWVDVKEIQKENERLKEALKNAHYPHKFRCKKPYTGNLSPCDCGLDELLEQ